MVAPNWSVTVQYDHMSFGTKSVGFQGVGFFPSFSEDIRQHVQVVLVGLNYRFSSGGR
jgi:opacity protein-like surface antigen